MTIEELIIYISKTALTRKWHWFGYHLKKYIAGKKTNFSSALISALLNIDKYIVGYAKTQIDRMASINGREKYLPDYEQLMQICGEIYVINQVVNYFQENAAYELEPHLAESRKNPELNVSLQKIVIGLEVKVPSLLKYQASRPDFGIQIMARHDGLLDIETFSKEQVLLPRDNPVKDFLDLANQKFALFKKNAPNYVSILYILWDDFIQEPISALLTKPHGLFRENSFAKDKDNNILKFENVDYIFLDRFITNFQRDVAECPLLDGKGNFLQYGSSRNLPIPFMINPFTHPLQNEEIIECLQGVPIDDCLGAEYEPLDFIFFMKN